MVQNDQSVQVRLRLNAKTVQALSRLSDLTGKSVPKLVAQFMDENIYVLETMGEALEAARRLEGVARAEYTRGLAEAADELSQHVSDAHRIMGRLAH